MPSGAPAVEPAASPAADAPPARALRPNGPWDDGLGSPRPGGRPRSSRARSSLARDKAAVCAAVPPADGRARARGRDPPAPARVRARGPVAPRGGPRGRAGPRGSSGPRARGLRRPARPAPGRRGRLRARGRRARASRGCARRPLAPRRRPVDGRPRAPSSSPRRSRGQRAGAGPETSSTAPTRGRDAPPRPWARARCGGRAPGPFAGPTGPRPRRRRGRKPPFAPRQAEWPSRRRARGPRRGWPHGDVDAPGAVRRHSAPGGRRPPPPSRGTTPGRPTPPQPSPADQDPEPSAGARRSHSLAQDPVGSRGIGASDLPGRGRTHIRGGSTGSARPGSRRRRCAPASARRRRLGHRVCRGPVDRRPDARRGRPRPGGARPRRAERAAVPPHRRCLEDARPDRDQRRLHRFGGPPGRRRRLRHPRPLAERDGEPRVAVGRRRPARDGAGGPG